MTRTADLRWAAGPARAAKWGGRVHAKYVITYTCAYSAYVLRLVAYFLRVCACRV